MKYYKDTNGNLYANPSNLDGLVEVESAVRADGTLLPKHKNLSLVQTKEDGSYYEFYNLEGTPDLVKIAEVEATVQAQVAKQAKLEALATLTVTTTAGNEFDGDDVARSDMMAAKQASEILGITSSNWKLADNSWKLIELSELKEALALAIQAKGNILGS